MTERVDCLRMSLRGAMLRRALLTMIVVGTILNAINQGDAILAGTAVSWPKLVLTYAVPFCVATFGAWSALMSLHARSRDGARQR